MEEKKNQMLPPQEPMLEEPPLMAEAIQDMPQLILDATLDETPIQPEPMQTILLTVPTKEQPGQTQEEAPGLIDPLDDAELALLIDPDADLLEDSLAEPDGAAADFTEDLPILPDWIPTEVPASQEPESSLWDAPQEAQEELLTAAPAAEPVTPAPEARPRTPRKGRPKRKKGSGLFGLPHLAATVVWLAIILMIGTSLGRMIWVAAADVLAFGRESKQVYITITSNDTIDDITEKLHDAGLIRYPAVFKFYAKLAVDDGDIIPGTFEMDTIYDYHALVVQMGPRSSNRTVVEDVLIPEGLNCRQIFELLEQNNICTVKELEEYAANGEFSDFWFLEGVERGDKYCLEGFLFPDTYDFYANSTPREALGKMLLGFEARFTEDIYAQLPALNERLSAMMRGKGCSEEYIAEHQLDLRDLLTVASLIEEETASVKESPIIASVIFNRLTEDQIYERYLNIDAAIIYATGDASNIDTSIDHPYNTYKYPGLTPGPISNPGLDSINAALNFADTEYYYYVLNPETGMHQFSMTLAEHEAYVEQFRGVGE